MRRDLARGAAALEFDVHVAEGHVLERGLGPAFDGAGGAVYARGVHAGDGDAVGRVARLEQEMERRGHVLHRDVGDQHVVEVAGRPVPGPRLEVDAGEHVVAVRGAVRLDAGAVEQAIANDQVRGRTDQADAVAGGVHDAVGDDDVLPVAAGNRVVAGVEAAADDAHVLARMVRRAAKVHAVPAAGEFDVANVHVLADLEVDGVIRRSPRTRRRGLVTLRQLTKTNACGPRIFSSPVGSKTLLPSMTPARRSRYPPRRPPGSAPGAICPTWPRA